MCDTHTVSGAVGFVQACKKEGIRPLLGAEIAVSNSERNDFTLVLICKNKEGWRQLLNIVSISNERDNFKGHPCIDLDDLKPFLKEGNLIVIDGYFGSLLYEVMFDNVRDPVFADSYERAAQFLRRKWNDHSLVHIMNMKALVGDDYYLETSHGDPVSEVLTECMRGFRETGVNLVAGRAVHYLDHPEDQRLCLCVKLKTPIAKIEAKLQSNGNYRYAQFFQHESFALPAVKELVAEEYQPFETEALQKIVDKCEEFEIVSQPKLPHFVCPDGMSENEYLRQLCREGWRKHLIPSGKVATKEESDRYRDRVQEELAIFEEAGIAGYFLIVQDIINKFRDEGNLIGPGRGSAAGCLVSYLIGVTLIDPLPYDLLFTRFYNAGRNTKDRVSLPDIDIDFPPNIREDVINYIKETYGEDRVCQILTLGRMQGRSALQEVLRVNESCSSQAAFVMTGRLPREDKISDKLAGMDDPSVIRWTLENDPKCLQDYCWLNEDGELQGEYAEAFKQAMRIEGTFKSQGIHAAGVIVAAEPLSDICPLTKPAKGSQIIGGMEMNDLEAVGAVKLDILGVSLLEKIQGVTNHNLKLEIENEKGTG